MSDPALIDLAAWKNAPFRRDFDASLGGVPVDLTGLDARMQVRLYQGAAGDPLIDVSTFDETQGAITITDAAAGILEIYITQAALEALPTARETGSNKPDAFQYDVIVGGENAVVFYGNLFVYPGVTR